MLTRSRLELLHINFLSFCRGTRMCHIVCLSIHYGFQMGLSNKHCFLTFLIILQGIQLFLTSSLFIRTRPLLENCFLIGKNLPPPPPLPPPPDSKFFSIDTFSVAFLGCKLCPFRIDLVSGGRQKQFDSCLPWKYIYSFIKLPLVYEWLNATSAFLSFLLKKRRVKKVQIWKPLSETIS